MKKKLVAILLTMVMVLTMTTGFASALEANVANAGELYSALHYATDNSTRYLTLTDNITLDGLVWTNAIKGATFVIDGQNHTITIDKEQGSEASSYMFQFSGKQSTSKNTVTFKNVTIKATEWVRSAILLSNSNNDAFFNLVLENVTIDMSDSCYNSGYGAAIVNNGNTITLKGNVTFITGENNYNAIDLDLSHGTSQLVIDENANVQFIDNRLEVVKAVEPLIGFDGGTNPGTVTGAKYARLKEVHKGEKDGYDIKLYPEVWEPYYETLALKIQAQAEIEAQKMLEDAKVIEKEEVITPILGGWNVVNGEVTEEAKAALNKALEGFTGSGYTPVKLMATQLVSGMNYKLLCAQTMITSEPVKALKVVTVYQDLSGNCSITNVEDYTLDISAEQTIAPNDKNSVKVSWDGEGLFEGYETYRAEKGSDKYTKMFDTTNDWYYNTLITLGKEYTYKVKGYVTVDGEKVYTEYSNETMQLVK